MSRLLVTEHARLDARLAWALTEAAGAEEHDRTLATLAVDGHGDSCAIEALGIDVLPLGRMSAPTVERALAGAAGSLRPDTITLWGSTRALFALPTLRSFFPRPTIETHIAPREALPWDEATLVSIRAQGLIDRYAVEEPSTRRRLVANGVRDHQIVDPPRPVSSTQANGHGVICILHGLSWERRSDFAAHLVSELHARGHPRAVAMSVAEIMPLLHTDPTTLTAVVAVEHHPISAAPLRAAAAAGARLAAATHGPTDSPISATGTLALTGDEGTWTNQLDGWLGH